MSIDERAMTEQVCIAHADECARRSRTAGDWAMRTEWSQLSIEWHYLAHFVLLGDGQTGPTK